MKVSFINDGWKQHVNKDFWICDYRYRRIDEKPIRHIRPTFARVISNEKLYEGFHFCEVKNGKVLNKIIKHYDNSYPGTPVSIFTTKEECEEAYNEMKKVNDQKLEEWFLSCQNMYQQLKIKFFI